MAEQSEGWLNSGSTVKKDGGTFAEHGKDWRNGKNNGRAVRRKVNNGGAWKRSEEQWQSSEKEGGQW